MHKQLSSQYEVITIIKAICNKLLCELYEMKWQIRRKYLCVYKRVVGLVFMNVHKIQLRKWVTQIIKTIQEQINSNMAIIYPYNIIYTMCVLTVYNL